MGIWIFSKILIRKFDRRQLFFRGRSGPKESTARKSRRFGDFRARPERVDWSTLSGHDCIYTSALLAQSLKTSKLSRTTFFQIFSISTLNRERCCYYNIIPSNVGTENLGKWMLSWNLWYESSYSILIFTQTDLDPELWICAISNLHWKAHRSYYPVSYSTCVHSCFLISKEEYEIQLGLIHKIVASIVLITWELYSRNQLWDRPSDTALV